MSEAIRRAVAVIPVRSGVLPIGALETIAEADGRCWLVGSGCQEALAQLEGHVGEVWVAQIDRYEPRAWSKALAAHLPLDEHLIVPLSPDGRDLAPHLAAELGRPLLAGATELNDASATLARRGGLTMERLALDGPVVATFQIGVRGVPDPDPGRSPSVEGVAVALADTQASIDDRVELIEELPADPATMDLAEAPRIVAGGAGLGEPEHFAVLDDVSIALGASVGATRVVTDWGWLSADRQIGTTGVTVDPDLYLAVGISGAVQHTAGLGNPSHVIVVNTDPSCPMMDLADVGITCDGPAFVAALRDALSGFSRTPSSPSSRHEQDPEA